MESTLKVGDKAPNATVLDAQGTPVELEDTWRDGPVLLTFLRHFGCLHCRYMLAQLEQHRDEIKAAGLKPVAVSLGEPKHAAHFCGKLAPSVDCLVNKTNEVHFAYGLKRSGVEALFNPKLYKAS